MTQQLLQKPYNPAAPPITSSFGNGRFRRPAQRRLDSGSASNPADTSRGSSQQDSESKFGDKWPVLSIRSGRTIRMLTVSDPSHVKWPLAKEAADQRPGQDILSRDKWPVNSDTPANADKWPGNADKWPINSGTPINADKWPRNSDKWPRNADKWPFN